MHGSLRAALAALVLTAASCRRDAPDQEANRPRPAPAARTENPSAAPPADAYDLTAHLSSCDLLHRGISLDFGTRAADLRRTYAVGPFPDTPPAHRAGGSFARVLSRTVSYEFWLNDKESNLSFSARVFGAASPRLHLQLDGKSVGTAKLARGETKVVEFPTVRQELEPGRHVLTLRFSGRVPTGEAFAELDWLRIHVPDELNATYAAPTLDDVISDVVLDSQPRRSIVLRAPSRVRCAIQPSSDAELKLMLGFWGEGEGAASVRLLRDGEPPVTLAERRVTGGNDARWAPLSIDLAPYADQLVALEFLVSEAAAGGRVVLGEPAIVRKRRTAAKVPEAKNVVVIVAAGLDRRRIPPWGPVSGLSALGELSRLAAAFSSYRVPTTLAPGVMATLITGLPPRAHALEDLASRLPKTQSTLPRTVKEASGATAFFSGVPTTFQSFGFDAGWDQYETISPVKDEPAHEPLTLATRWLEQELAEPQPEVRRLLVVHTRGAHPPWDLSREEVALLPPEEYGGALDARRGAIVLAGLRGRHHRAERRLSEEDWIRLRALQAAALHKQNAAMAQLFSTLRRFGAWDETLLVFMGDVAIGDPPDLPFDPAPSLREDRLLVPLLVKFPGNGHAGVEVHRPTTTLDVTQTILQALRVKLPDRVQGLDLHELAAGASPIVGRPLVATLGPAYSTRSGRYLLHGTLGSQPELCLLDIDPSCANDALLERPIAATAMWRWTYAVIEASRAARRSEREPASIDPDTAAALTAWGDIH